MIPLNPESRTGLPILCSVSLRIRHLRAFVPVGPARRFRSVQGFAGADAEQRLDPLTVQMACVHAAEHVENFRKSVKPGGFGRHRAGLGSTRGKGAIRHYMIFWRLRRNLIMNDKGHYHSY